jgi:hypothetical protein
LKKIEQESGHFYEESFNKKFRIGDYGSPEKELKTLKNLKPVGKLAQPRGT